LGDQRFLEPNSGLYYQISARGMRISRSRSLWDRALNHDVDRPMTDLIASSDSDQFPDESLRIMERGDHPAGSDTLDFHGGAARAGLDGQIRALRNSDQELSRCSAWACS
jgi:hypothetical protein